MNEKKKQEKFWNPVMRSLQKKKEREEKQPTLNAVEIFLFRFRQSPWYLTVSPNENGRW